MIIDSNKRIIYFFAAILLSIIVACIGTSAIYVYKVHPAPFYLTAVVEVLCAIFMAISIGMLFNEDSRINGVIFGILLAALSYFYVTSPGANIDLFCLTYAIGLIIGAIVVVFTVLNNRFDILVKISKYILTILVAIIIIYLIYEMSLAIAEATFAYALNSILFYVIGMIVVAVFYVIAMMVTAGVCASEIFVFGPRSSGKTLFLVGLREYMVLNYNGSDDFVSLYDETAKDSEGLSIGEIYAKMVQETCLRGHFVNR